jgi:prevent-host-death family protein
MKTANAQEVPQHWTEILQWVAAGEDVQVTSEGRPVARLTPWKELCPFIGATVGGPALPPDLDEPTVEKW